MSKLKKIYYFYIEYDPTDPDLHPDDRYIAWLSIVEKSFFDANGHMNDTDSYPKELEETLEKLDYGSEMEWVWSKEVKNNNIETIQSLKLELINAGLVKNNNFTKFMDSLR